MSYNRFMEHLDTQICTSCQLDKVVGDFYLHVQGHRWKKCKICVQRDAAASRKKNPEKVKAQLWKSNLKRKYGLTPEQFESMMDAQDGKCAICLDPFQDKKKIHVDHDHSCCTGSFTCGSCIRALLCSSCNMALGLFKDDPARIRRAVNYLVED